MADFGLSRTVERTGNDLSLFHARWTAPEVWEDYMYFDEEPIEGKGPRKHRLSMNLFTFQ